jgi:hypothetical protein
MRTHRGMLLAGALLACLWSERALAHCDSLDGPVVGAARDALQAKDVGRVLVWVQKADEPVIRAAFARTLAVRKLGPEAKDLADMYFFETLVRVHRAGEGEPYTGLKPAGRDIGPAIPAADRALQTGDVEPLVRLLTERVAAGVRDRFSEARSLRGYRKDDVEAGRRFVAAYVEFIHYAEGAQGEHHEP